MVQLATNIHEMTQLVLMDRRSHAIFNQHRLAILVFSIVLYWKRSHFLLRKLLFAIS